MNPRVAAALAGFLLLGLSPSFIDWQESDSDHRREIAVYYGIALTLIYFGAMRRS
jgi:hypothetical protein